MENSREDEEEEGAEAEGEEEGMKGSSKHFLQNICRRRRRCPLVT